MLDLKKRLQDEIQQLEYELKVDAAEGDPEARASTATCGRTPSTRRPRSARAICRRALRQLHRRLAALNMVNLDRIPRDKVGLGSLVTVAVEESGEETVFEIVVPEDADPTIGRISPSSPIGKCLLGHEEGDTVEVRVPAGVRTYEIRKLVTMHDQVEEASSRARDDRERS